MLLIDGQQRCTTTQLLLIAIRDAAWELLTSTKSEKAVRLIEDTHQQLFNNKAVGNAWIAKTIESLASGK
jgi:uncharacterized membrane protein YqjE